MRALAAMAPEFKSARAGEGAAGDTVGVAGIHHWSHRRLKCLASILGGQSGQAFGDRMRLGPFALEPLGGSG